MKIFKKKTSGDKSFLPLKESSGIKFFFKVKRAKSPIEYFFERVTIWRDDPREAWKILGYIEKYGEIKECQKKYGEVVRNHSLPWVLCEYINSLAIKCVLQSKNARKGDVSYNIPAKVINNSGTKKEKSDFGIISWGVNKRNECFHFCFSKRPLKRIFNQVQRRFDDSEISSLRKQNARIDRVDSIDNEYNLKISENECFVFVKDEKNKIDIRLCKVKAEYPKEFSRILGEDIRVEEFSCFATRKGNILI